MIGQRSHEPDDSEDARPQKMIILAAQNSSRPQPFLVCRTCGHEVEIGTFMRLEAAQDLDPEEIARRRRTFEEERRREAREALSNASFPIYAAIG